MQRMRREPLFLFTVIIAIVLIFQVANYAADWLVVRRIRQFSYEVSADPLGMFVKKRGLRWAPEYVSLVEKNVPEDETILFVNTPNNSKPYLYLMAQTYINKKYTFFFEMFGTYNTNEAVAIYMKENNYKYWVKFIDSGDGRSRMELYLFDGAILHLVDAYG